MCICMYVHTCIIACEVLCARTGACEGESESDREKNRENRKYKLMIKREKTATYHSGDFLL